MTSAPQVPTNPKAALASLWRLAGGPAGALDAVTLTGSEPALPSSFAIGTAAQASIAASALAAAEVWRLRTGRQQQISVAMRDAAIEFRSERYMRVEGKASGEVWDKIAGLYRCGDGRWVRLHTNFPHHRDGVLKLLGCDYSREAVQRALDGWEAEKFETAAAEAGLVVTMTRSFAEWDAHPQGQAVSRLPIFSIEKIGDAPQQPLPPGDRPLSGVRVLDLTRVIAGPVCGRTLAVHGADVMLVTAAHLPQMMPLVMDNGRGKLSTFIDLREASGRETLGGLARDADIFVQGYRPGAVKRKRLRPGGGRAAAAGHRLRLALRLRPRRPVGEPARLRLAGAERERHQPRGGRSRRKRAAKAPALPGDRSRERLSDGVRRDDGARAPRARRRKLACARLARADRPLDPRAWAHRRAWRARPRLGRRAGPAGGARLQGSESSRPCAIPQRCRKRRRTGRGLPCRSARMSRGGRSPDGAQRNPGRSRIPLRFMQATRTVLPPVSIRPPRSHSSCATSDGESGRVRRARRPTSAETAQSPRP